VPKGSHFEWTPEAMDEENFLGDTSQANDATQDTISILSDISEEDVPDSDQHTLNIFLHKAMNNMEESIKRGSNSSAKATYAVRIGQKQARRTEYQHTQNKKRALEEGWQGGNLITNWFQPKAGPHTNDLQENNVTYSQDPKTTDITARFPANSTPLHSPNSTVPPQSLSTPNPLISTKAIPPTLDQEKSALANLINILKPPRDSEPRYKEAKMDLLLWGQLEMMKMFLITYIDWVSRGAASTWCATCL